MDGVYNRHSESGMWSFVLSPNHDYHFHTERLFLNQGGKEANIPKNYSNEIVSC